MTTHATTPLDSHHHHHPHTLYSNRTYARTTSCSSTANRPFHSYLKTLPPINICENLLYDVAIGADVESATSSSYINSSEHYDNTYTNTYDNPIQYFENYPSKSVNNVKRSLSDLPHDAENFYDHAKETDDGHGSSTSSHSTSPVLFYLENKNLAICACIISLLLLLLIGLGIFLLNKLIRPVIINTTVNNHYGILNMSNTTTTTTMPSRSTTTMPSRSTTTTSLVTLLRRSSTESSTTIDSLTASCPPDRWGTKCENTCKPCGLGVCHPITGKCICPKDIYGEFCDLWRVNDKPKRGDMTS